MHDYDATRKSWNHATRNHNAHKGDQAAWLRSEGSTLFPEEMSLLGDVGGQHVVHLQCNSGQDSLSLAKRGAHITGVDFSNEAIAFAKRLSADSGIAATFVEAEVVSWMNATEERFDIAFSSYGATGWLPDLAAWARGVSRILKPHGRLVYVEFHPVLWSIGKDSKLSGDDYFSRDPFIEPVGDYVQDSGSQLFGGDLGHSIPNPTPAHSYQYGIGDMVTALIVAGLAMETLQEFPYANGCKVHSMLVPDEGRRWRWPDGTARVPLMYALSARRI